MVCFLSTQAWVNRTSSLAVGDAVTVESPDKSIFGALEPAMDSYWAEVVELPPPPIPTATVESSYDPTEQIEAGQIMGDEVLCIMPLMC